MYPQFHRIPCTTDDPLLVCGAPLRRQLGRPTFEHLILCFRDWVVMQQQVRDHPDFDRWFLEYPEVISLMG
jgi:hypothetical protein